MRGPWWLLPAFFIWGMLAVWVAKPTRIVCRVPECSRCLRGRLTGLAVAVAAWVLLVVSFVVVAEGTVGNIAALALLITLIGAPVVTVMSPSWGQVRGSVSRDRQTVKLRPVSARFTQALGPNP